MEKQENYFGSKIYDFNIIFGDEKKNVLAFIREQLKPLYDSHDVDIDNDFEIIKDNIKKDYHKKEIENKIIEEIDINTQSDDKNTIIERAKLIASQISPSIIEHFNEEKVAIADIGCGDGLVPYILKENSNINININQPVLLTDVIDYIHEDIKKDRESFQFIRTGADEWDAEILKTHHEKYDVALLLTVLHHSVDPSFILSNIPKLLKDNGLLIVIESCIDIKEADIPADSSVAIKKYVSFSKEDQMLYGSFMDWFYNKLIHYKENVPVPYNFTSPDKWNRIIKRYGLKNISTEVLGFDQELVPEFHTLHVFKK